MTRIHPTGTSRPVGSERYTLPTSSDAGYASLSTHMTKPARVARLPRREFDLEFTFADAVRFIPVHFLSRDLRRCDKAYECESFHLPPVSAAVRSNQPI